MALVSVAVGSEPASAGHPPTLRCSLPAVVFSLRGFAHLLLLFDFYFRLGLVQQTMESWSHLVYCEHSLDHWTSLFLSLPEVLLSVPSVYHSHPIQRFAQEGLGRLADIRFADIRWWCWRSERPWRSK